MERQANIIISRLTLYNIIRQANNFIMHNQKSWGASTKSSSHFINSPIKQALNVKALMLQQGKERQIAFLREKNQQLTNLVLRMGEQISKLNKDKNQLLTLNSKYIDTLNKQFKQNHLLFDQYKKAQDLPKNCSTCKCKILLEFQSDYRNLVRHCIDLEQQINSKNKDINELQQIKKELAESKHTLISDLIEQLVDTTHQLVSLKKAYNKQQFQLQKIIQRYEKLNQTIKDNQKAASGLAYEIENYKSIINTINNQANDKENGYKSKIYSMQLTIQKLQKDVRESQKQFEYVSTKNTMLKAEQIEMIQHGLTPKQSLNKNRMSKSQSMRKSRNK